MQSLEPPKQGPVPTVLASGSSRDAGTSPSDATPIKATVLIAFGSRFGNTERIAGSLAAGMRKARGVAVDCLFIDEVPIESLGRYDFLAFGGPTEKRSASKAMKEFLAGLPPTALRGKRGFAFDTRFDLPMAGSAEKFIEKSLEQLGVEIVRPHTSAFVRGMNKEEKALYGNVGTPDWMRKVQELIPREAPAGPARLDLLDPGSEARFEKIGTELAATLASASPLPLGAQPA